MMIWVSGPGMVEQTPGTLGLNALLDLEEGSLELSFLNCGPPPQKIWSPQIGQQ